MAKDKKEKVINKLRTPLFRAAFCSVYKKRKYENGDEKYEITCLFPKEGENKADLTKLKAAAAKAAKEKWPTGIPKGLRSPFRDGDDVDWDGFEGNFFIRATSVYAPKVINRQEEPLLTEEEFYAGCWAYATVNAYAYEKKGNKGVSFGIQNLLFVRDDEPFSGRSKAEDDFADLIETEGTDGDGAAAPGGDGDGDDIFA